MWHCWSIICSLESVAGEINRVLFLVNVTTVAPGVCSRDTGTVSLGHIVWHPSLHCVGHWIVREGHVAFKLRDTYDAEIMRALPSQY